jgi:hypothetical protein
MSTSLFAQFRKPARTADASLANFCFGSGCRDDASRATVGLPSAAEAPLQRSELAKSATLYGPAARSKMAFEIDERESCNNVFGL